MKTDLINNNERLNLLSGAYTAEFAEYVLEFTNYDCETLERMTNLFTTLYNSGMANELMETIKILHNIMGMSFPDDITNVIQNSEALQFYLYEFLLDLEEIYEDWLADAKEYCDED